MVDEVRAARVATAGLPSTDVDVAIVGGGLSGMITAIQLGRMGYRIALFDLHEVPRSEFRAEQLVGPQVGRLAELGLLEPMTRESRLVREAANARLGRLLDRTAVDQYGVPYQSMIAAVRAQLPPSVRFLPKRVSAIETGPDIQRVLLGDGEACSARLIVLATGLSSVLSKRLGIESRMIRMGHSLALGFDMTIDDPAAALPLIYYGERTRDRIDYLALFPMHESLRANLFCYGAQGSDWVRAFCRDPEGCLREMLPGLREIVGAFAVTSPVQVRSNDLRTAVDPARNGLVLVGDAFQTPCPAAGTGIDRLLSDVDILCGRHAAAWLATPGMGREKIAAFYADPVKRAFDAECLRIADYRRALSTRETLWWTLHRKQVFLRRRLKALTLRRPFAVGTMAPSA